MIQHDITMKKQIFVMFLLSLLTLTAHADRTVRATDAGIRFTGRVERLADGAVRYDWVGTYVQTAFTGTSISVRMSEEGESYHQVFIDGKLLGKLHFTGKEPHDVTLAKGLSKGQHVLRLQKVTEGEFGRTTLYSFTTTGTGTFKAVAPKDRLIEIIGDSYTCGYGAEGSETSHFEVKTENCDKAYACLIARYFNADYVIAAHSGMGVVRNYAGKKLKTMSQRYPMLYDDHDSIAYDFTQYKPNLVIINLGTNDFSTEAAPAGYVDGYVRLIQTVRSHYGDVPVLCVTPHSANIFLLAALEQLRQRVSSMKDVRVAEPMPDIVVKGHDIGSDYHPNWKGHQKIASTLIPVVATMTGWEMHNDL